MEPSAFLTGCVANKGRDVPIFAVASSPPNEGTIFYARPGSDWVRYSVEVEWAAIAMAVLRYAGAADVLVVALGAQGQFWELEPGRSAQRTGQLPDAVSDVTNAAVVHGAIWLCGMDRIAWMRDAQGHWHDMSAPPGQSGDGVVGFTAIAQASPDEVVAVGWGGEIWWRDRSGWQLQDSGTNANLNAVAAISETEVVAVGDRGVVVQGTHGRWQVFATLAAFNLQDACCFDGEVFVCSDFELFLWRNGSLEPETRFAAQDRPATCMRLRAGAQTLFSIGESDIFRFEQGLWTRVI